MQKSELRKVSFRTPGYHNNWKNGYFHRWFEKVFDDRSSYLYFVVEDEDGKVILNDNPDANLKFVDRFETDEKDLDAIFGKK